MPRRQKTLAHGVVLTAFQSAVPAHLNSLEHLSQIYEHYREHGTTDAESTSISRTKHPNPIYVHVRIPAHLHSITALTHSSAFILRPHTPRRPQYHHCVRRLLKVLLYGSLLRWLVLRFVPGQTPSGKLPVEIFLRCVSW
jgi:hypothetical protein